MITFCFIYSRILWKLRNKTYNELNSDQKRFVEKSLAKEYSFRRMKYTPETYHIRLQKMAVFLLIFGITLIVVIASVFTYYFLFID